MNRNSKYGIIAIGYNRPDSMQRLLGALDKADYKGENVLLIISIDNSGTDIVEKTAQAFEWKYGNKIIKTYENRMGLREHILKCGTYLEEYDLDAVAVFEDDIYPSPAFYNYMKQTVLFYQNDDSIAGISLYSHLWNVNAQMPFEPAKNGYDVYFMAFAQSWGQVWMRKQWQEFVEWYGENKDKDKNIWDGIPETIVKWPESSWLKYHIAYCIKTNHYFVYPYQALATCFTDKGEHSVEHVTLHHVPLMPNSDKGYQLVRLEESGVVYDGYFERSRMNEILRLPEGSLCVDLYGSKNERRKTQYLLTERILPYEVKNSYALELRPHEENVIYGIDGKDIFLYDLGKKAEVPVARKVNTKIIEYYFRLNRSGRWLVEYAIKQKISICKENKKRR